MKTICFSFVLLVIAELAYGLPMETFLGPRHISGVGVSEPLALACVGVALLVIARTSRRRPRIEDSVTAAN